MTPPPISDWAERNDPRQRARSIRWLLCDVDGVLTDGRLTYSAGGEETKVFEVKDGLALKLAQRAGLKIGWLTARGGPAVERRARDLGIDALITRREDKREAFTEFCAEHDLEAATVAYIGDDLVDLPVLLACGLSFAPADAARDVRSRVDHVLGAAGGHGAVRELIEWLLDARGQWAEIIAKYTHPGDAP